MNQESASVHIVDFPEGFTNGCKKCRRIIERGTIAVGIAISEHRYFVGPEEIVTCCGEEKILFRLFTDEAEAEALKERVIDVMERDGTTENLNLMEAIRLWPATTAIH